MTTERARHSDDDDDDGVHRARTLLDASLTPREWTDTRRARARDTCSNERAHIERRKAQHVPPPPAAEAAWYKRSAYTCK